MQAVNRVGGQSFVYVVEEDKSKENRNLWCIKNLWNWDVQNDRYPVLKASKWAIRWQFNILKLRDGAPSNSNLRKAGESTPINQVHLRLMLFTLKKVGFVYNDFNAR